MPSPSTLAQTTATQCNHDLVPRRALLDVGGGDLHTLYSCLLHKFFIKPDTGRRPAIPAAILSNDKGMEYWHTITTLPRYYQTRDEIALLDQNCAELANLIPANACLIDLGSGDFTKARPLLDMLEKMEKPVKYFALDLSRACLREGILAMEYKHITCRGLWGTFDDAHDFARTILSGPRWFVSFGSMFGNEHFDSAVERLTQWRQIMGPDDRMLIGMDSCKNPETVWNSYHDSEGVFEEFLRNGLDYTNQILGHDWYRPQDWEIQARLYTEQQEGEPFMHKFIFKALRDVHCPELDLVLAKGTEVDCYESFKYAPDLMERQFASAGLQEIGRWRSPSKRIYQYLLSAIPEGRREM